MRKRKEVREAGEGERDLPLASSKPWRRCGCARGPVAMDLGPHAPWPHSSGPITGPRWPDLGVGRRESEEQGACRVGEEEAPPALDSVLREWWMRGAAVSEEGCEGEREGDWRLA